ncbi:MAG TPA: phenylalanine--tRNA ligase subunit alpha [Bacteroidia bacterium]|nr:phenylalanine--tRNA ligase subunit alpha [Bacteroidia bacterium]HRS59270.1 phenylalanine--tRNA ligase subunit alpha [Bacteroidia bacterium]HRU67140.1 phenylalanine--tRNA ligase subunit alpha [Bacteroidia bacterium]
MISKISGLIEEVDSYQPASAQELEDFRIKFLSKKGILNQLFEDFKQLDNDSKKETGKWINILKNKVNEKIELYKKEFEHQKFQALFTGLDLSMEAYPLKAGSRHPVSIVKNQIIDIFSKIGFTQSVGPEIVDDWHNFTALNFPPDHPARDMQDTFYLQKNPDYLLRTHTSSVQVQEMQAHQPPIKTISIGRVYRNETISYKSHVQFHQIEGLYVDKNVSFAELKQVLYYFVEQFFGSDFKIRFRPSFFPFTEPSAEMDISPVHGKTRWMEILGCGMVDPAVLDNCGIDSSIYTGYAFGIGIERLTMLKYGIPDIRILFENDVRFLGQFSSQ